MSGMQIRFEDELVPRQNPEKKANLPERIGNSDSEDWLLTFSTEQHRLDGLQTFLPWMELIARNKSEPRSETRQDGRKIDYDKNGEITRVEFKNGETRTFVREGEPPKLVAIQESDGTEWTSTNGKTFQRTGAPQDQITGKPTIKDDGTYFFKFRRGCGSRSRPNSSIKRSGKNAHCTARIV